VAPKDRAQRRLDAKRAAKQNRHELERLRREQARREKRRFLLVTAAMVVVGLIIVGAAVVPAWMKTLNSPGHRDIASYGASLAAASCDPDTKMAPEPGPNTADTAGQDQDRVHLDGLKDASKYPTWTYKNNPPASGPHFSTPMPAGTHYYDPSQTGTANLVERLVHNLEHGYVVVWYDASVAADKNKLAALDDIGTNLEQKYGYTNYIAAPWPSTRPAMPNGKHIALTAWHQRQLCSDISGAVVKAFVDAHPVSAAPEPNGQAPSTAPSATASATASAGSTATPTATSTVSSAPTSSASASPSASATPSSTKS
jgi:hypothetical protein